MQMELYCILPGASLNPLHVVLLEKYAGGVSTRNYCLQLPLTGLVSTRSFHFNSPRVETEGVIISDKILDFRDKSNFIHILPLSTPSCYFSFFFNFLQVQYHTWRRPKQYRSFLGTEWCSAHLLIWLVLCVAFLVMWSHKLNCFMRLSRKTGMQHVQIVLQNNHYCLLLPNIECLFGKWAPSFYCRLWSKWKQKSQYLDAPNLISGFEVCSGYCSPIQQDCLVKNQFRCLFRHCLWTSNNLYDLCNCYYWNPETMEVASF